MDENVKMSAAQKTTGSHRLRRVAATAGQRSPQR